MSLVKSNKRRTPMWRNPFLNDPFFSDLMDNRRWNRLFNGDEDEFDFSPAMNVKEMGKDIQVEMAAPGLSKDDFKITLDEGVLTVSAEKEQKEEEEREGFLRKEFSYNSFSRSIRLPENVDENKDIQATYKDGVLRMMLHKKEGTETKKPKSIRVN
ncbi:heat shock protein Hsp20 [Salinimicrobium catena]|uniref:Heat shock protein Hsp20 n=1 Tax=Salinimicrobium catena TaxID=390640 RepID=A0A1H5N1A9_9FLAO|nr:Hsp20/alpha crystallin family protein [Salinimicrobium catena]SDL33148.1 HSP20 family protein [Salinimicrobium catena]SEE94681.1 heat shock protein Hsp20 [Salinimicrobium catena]